MTAPADSNLKRRLTSHDVAKHAHVSQSIVSFYFTGKRPVSKDARERIEAAIEALGYRPNRVARSLRTQSTRLVAVFIPYISNPLYAAYAAGAEIALAEAGYLTIILSNRAVPSQIDDYFDMISDSQVDGLILFPFLDDVPRIERLRSSVGVPIVFVDRTIPVAPEMGVIDSVTIDNEGSVRAAVSYLLGLGHRRVALITGANPNYGAPRIAGYRSAYAQSGLTVPEECIFLGGGRVDEGFTVTNRILALADRPTALVVTMNLPTVGSLEALRRANIRIPEDISFIGFDTDDETHHLPEPIAAIRYPAIRLGRAAANVLVKRLRDEAGVDALHSSLGADLSLGSSTAPPLGANSP